MRKGIDRSTVDWQALEKDAQAGMSVRVLSLKYGPSKTSVHEYLHRNDVKDTADTTGTPGGKQGAPKGQAMDIVTLANKLVAQLADLTVGQNLEIKEHMLVASALSQYNKVMLTGVDLANNTQIIDWSIFTPEELDIIQPLFARAEERYRIESGESSIPQLRKKA